MEYTITGKSPEKLEEILAEYQKLSAQRDQLAARLEKVDKEKSSVSESIYEKVKSEYKKELDSLNAQIDPMEKEIDEVKREGERELAQLDEQIRALEEELSEAEFRHRVGEFDENKLVEIRSRVKSDLDIRSSRKSEISERLSSFASGDDNGTVPKSGNSKKADKAKSGGTGEGTSDHEALDTNDDGQSSRTPLSSKDPLEALTDKPAKERKSDSAGDESSPQTASESDGKESSFENPQVWINEFGEGKTAPPNDPAGSTENTGGEDPLSALADPSDEQRESSDAPDAGSADTDATAKEEVCMGFPNLVIVSGASSGKKVPLLPMTMSVGREHDNNIELKDTTITSNSKTPKSRVTTRESCTNAADSCWKTWRVPTGPGSMAKRSNRLR
jgi:hypothetical protein